MIEKLIWITEEFQDPVEQPEGEERTQHLKLQAGVQTTFAKDVILLKAVIEEMGILRTENHNLFIKPLYISKTSCLLMFIKKARATEEVPHIWNISNLYYKSEQSLGE